MSNWHNRRYTDSYWDHRRDELKTEPRPGDRDFPARLDQPLSTAMDIVLLVKEMTNYADAAALIERYADGKAAQTRLDAVAAGARP